MDWFERLTGFRETSYHDTRAKLKVDGSRLRASRACGWWMAGCLPQARSSSLPAPFSAASFISAGGRRRPGGPCSSDTQDSRCDRCLCQK